MCTQLQDLGYVKDIEDVKAFLFDNEDVPASFLDAVQYSLSTSGDLISFLHKNRLVITKLNLSSESNAVEYEVTHKGVVADINTECASCLLSLSVALQQKSVGATTLIKTSTWNCIAVGFTSGYFRIYTETGVQLFEQIFHPQPIRSMKYCVPKVLQDELLVIYDEILVAVDGFSLYQCLRFCRMQQLRSSAGSNAAKNVTISFKKWSLQDQKSTIDVEFYGVRNTTPFEHLYQASLAGGSANYIGQAGLGPVYNYVAVGKGPFIAQYCPSEQAAQPIMSEVVMNVATKLMSYIPGSSWLTGWSQAAKENQPTFEPPIAISKNICIDDPRREIVSIKASPRGNLAVLADTFGRLLLLDVSSMILVNIWKGYRDAQCGWVVVPCKQVQEPAGKPQQTLFLVIYAKKRGILEIWCPYQHYRVAAFNVGKKGVLLSSMYGALGEGSLSSPLAIPEWRSAKSCCFLIQQDGKITNINIPFENCLGPEYLLSLEDSKLVDKACAVMESENFSSEHETEIEALIPGLKLAVNVRKVLQAVIDAPQIPSSFKTKLCNTVIADISATKELHQQPEFLKLYQFCDVFVKLTALYTNISDHWKSSQFLSSSAKSPLLADIQPAIEKYFVKAKVNSSFEFPGIIEFTKSFVITPGVTSLNEQAKLTIDVPNPQKEIISRFLTLLFLYSEDWIPILDQLLNCGLSLSSIFIMFIEACLTLDIQISSEPYQQQISSVIQHLLSRFEDSKDLWDIMFDVLKSNKNVCHGLILAVYCQAIAVESLEFTTTTFETEEDSQKTDSDTGSGDDQSEWVALDPEHEQWYTTRQQLSDVLHLQINTGVDCTVNTLLDSNDQTVTHVVANFIIENDLVQNFIDWVERCRIHKAEDAEDSDSEEVFDDNLNWLLNVVPWWPYQLHPTTISVCLIECLIFRWSAVLDEQSPDVDVKHLESASKILLSLRKSVSVQQTLLNVLWETVFCSKVKKMYALIEKIGRQPKDRICVKELSLTLSSAISFISIARHILVNVDISSDPNEDKFVLKQENVWASENRSWLLHKVVNSESRINQDFVILHAQIVTALELIITLNIKNIRPSVLFHSKFNSLLFTPLTSTGFFKSFTSPEIDTLHEQMLKMCVKSAVSSDMTIEPYQNSWMSVIVNIATLWDIAVPIQSYIAVFLYSLGKFEEADEIVLTSSHRNKLGVELLNVLLSLLEMLIFYDETSQKLYLPVLTPSLSSWLRSKRDPNVALLDMSTVFKAFSNILTWTSGDDVIINNSRELRASLLKVL